MPGKGPGQRVHRHLGGEGREEDRARGGRLRIGVHQPVVQEGEAGLDPEGQEDEPGGEAVQPQVFEGDAPRLVGMDQGPGQEKDTAHHVHHQIPDPGGQRPLALPGPDQEDRAQRQDLPEDEEGDEVPGEHRPQGAPCVEESGGVLKGRPLSPLQVEGEEEGQEGGQMEQVAEEETQLVHPHQGEGVAQDGDLPEGARLQADEAEPAHHGNQEEEPCPGPSPKEWGSGGRLRRRGRRAGDQSDS